ncbi:DEAD/DEAH box helicase [Pantoea agglomerans]
MSNGTTIANQIGARLSLRKPQTQSLDILCRVLEQLKLDKEPDLQRWMQVLKSEKLPFKNFERTFPSLCFALATGVGKTRLMGAMIAWLYLTGRSNHFFVLAPNLTIYEKLKQDFLPGSPKYVFQGIPELAQFPPVLITGDDYQEGRGVRLDQTQTLTATGDLFAGDTAPHINIFNVSKINALDNKQGAEKSKQAKVRRIQEYIGDSYFNYLAELPDLVVLMDEAHRYYASSGATALNDLNPVLGIELTATPKTTGAKPRDFKNIVYHYPLASALDDGYVKIPAVATRKDFKASSYTTEQIEKIKLEDGIHHHEYVKTELASYANNTGRPAVKPFMLIVAQDTTHAETIKAKIEDIEFFGGAYKGKVITVHSNQTGEESEENTQRLLAVEHDKDTEIVVHVNKLKEGWDVTNLYTIVPLRASASEILTEQTIGRGLRLPYGKRTGVEAVDRLTIIAHDRFQEIIDRANEDDSIIKKILYIGDNDDETGIPEHKPKQVIVPSLAETLLGRQLTDGEGCKLKEEPAVYQVNGNSHSAQTLNLNEVERKVAEITVKIVSEEAQRLGSSKELNTPTVQQSVVRKVQQVMQELVSQSPLTIEQAALPGFTPPVQTTVIPFDDAAIKALVGKVTEKLVEHTIDIPQIVILPTREVNYGFTEFDLSSLNSIAQKPSSQEMLLQNLKDNSTSTISWDSGGMTEARHEDYLVRFLIDHDEIDYQDHADILYRLAGQMVQHLEGYLSHEEAEVLLKTQGRQLADFIWAQLKNHMWTTPTDYIGKITKGFDVLRPATFNYAHNEHPRDFRAPVQAGEKSKVRQMLFTGFSKCCYPDLLPVD